MYLRRIIFNLIRKDKSVTSNLLKRHYIQCVTNTENRWCIQKLALGIAQYSNDSKAKCWKCNYINKAELFCSQCKAIQEFPTNINLFDIMGMRLEYDLSSEELHNRYRHLQKMLHPDKFASKSEKEKEISENVSSLVNKAYSTLSNPLQRGLYILKLNNESIEEGAVADAMFLIKIMEKNEEIEEASMNKEEILKLTEENKAILHTLIKEVSDAFQANDIQTAKKLLVKMNYYDSIEIRLKKIKQNLGLVD